MSRAGWDVVNDVLLDRQLPEPSSAHAFDDQGRTLPLARVAIATASTLTDQDGRFEIKLPADLPEGDCAITITATGYEPRRYQAAPGGTPLRVLLSRSPESK